MTDISAQPEKPEAAPTMQEELTEPKPDKLKASSPKEDKPSKRDKKSKKEKRSKKHRSRSRSASESTGESKSRERKASKSRDKNDKKRTKKHKKHRRRSHSSDSGSSSRSRSRSHRRRSSGRRRRDYDRQRDRGSDRSHHNRDHDRGHDRSRKRDSGKDKERTDGRSRTRSPHPLLKRTVQEVPVRPKIEDANKSKMFWDGFQWVSKANATTATTDPAMLTQTKKMRRLTISNLPLHLGLGEREIGEFVTKFIIENYLNDEGNFQPVREVTVDSTRNSATIELSSVEEASRLAKVESIKILGTNCRVSKVSESKFGATTNVATLVVEAQRTAQAQAAALAAMSMLQKKDGGASFTLSKVNVLGNASKILKVTNLVEPTPGKEFSDQQLNEVLEDIGEEFGKFGKVNDQFIVKQGKVAQGAEAGTVFITFENENVAEKAMNAMTNKRYDGKEIRVIFVDEETFQKNFAQLKN